MKRIITLLVFLLIVGSKALGQGSNATWYFGEQAALRFTAGSPLPTSIVGSAMNTYEACASVADEAGQLQFYTNGEKVWDRANNVMPNGNNIQSHLSASQGALVLQDFTDAKKYYLFTVDACQNYFAAGLRYSIVNMALRGGLGDIGAQKNVLVPSPQRELTEKLTAIRHANGRDYWIVVHGWQTNQFYSYLFSATGISSTPRVSSVGIVHSGGIGSFGNENSVGHLKASPNGRLLACAIRDDRFQLFDFDPATGSVSNARTLGLSAPYYYGAEFSPDGTKLYTTDLPGNALYQIDVSDNLRVTRIANTSVPTGAVQRGPDGQLYVAMDRASYLGIITKPNNAGLACAFVERGVLLMSGISRIGLPNAVDVRTPISISIAGNLSLCVGNALSLNASSSSGVGVYTWDFGDPLSGLANTATSALGVHRYNRAGSYTITLTATVQQERIITTRTVIVSPLPQLSLGGQQRLLCPGSPLTLTPTAQPPGTTFLWQDNSNSATLNVQAPGRYTLRVTSPQGCVAEDAIDVLLAPQPVVTIVPSAPVCDNVDVTLQASLQPAGSTYRWQDGSTASSIKVTGPGLYSLEVQNSAGCVGRSTFLVPVKPSLSLGNRQQELCQGSSLTLTAGVQPAGTTYLWQDNSTGPTLTAQAPGRYTLRVTSPQGCTAIDAIDVVLSAQPLVELIPDAAVCADEEIVLQVGPQPAGSTYRWQDGSTASNFKVTSPGNYSVEVRNAVGCVGKDTFVALPSSCPFSIPNIITPNGDPENEYFVLKGLRAAAWNIVFFNRWGTEVYRKDSYDNTWNAKDQPAGLYYYQMKNQRTGQLLKGWVQVIKPGL